MMREMLALLLMIVLIAVSGLNIVAADRLCNRMAAELDEAERAARDGDWDRAGETVDAALERWNRAERYTHIFIRHSETANCTELFYELMESMSDKDAEASAPVFEKLRQHILSIALMEKPRLGSIF